MKLLNLSRYILSCDTQTAFGLIVQRWTNRDVINWLQGLDDSLNSYFENFIEKKIDGNILLSLTDGDLQDMGIDNLGTRKLLLTSLSVLYNLCFEAETENLQNLVNAVGVQARNLHNELKRHLTYHKINVHSNYGYLPNNFLTLISNLAEKSKKLMSWFDRPPFIDNERYADLRNSILTMTLDILDLSLNKMLTKLDDKQLATNLQISCTQLFTICDRIIEENNDPLFLQTAYFERCAINKRSLNDELGLHVESSPDGVHVITEVKFQTPADVCRKIDAGDEIVEINGQTVVGWSQDKMVTFLSAFNHTGTRLSMLLKKRPRETWNIYKTTPSTPRLRKTTTMLGHMTKTESAAGKTTGKSKNHSCASTSTVVTNGSSASSSISNQAGVHHGHGHGHRRRSSSFTVAQNSAMQNFDQQPQSGKSRSKKQARKWKSAKSPTCPITALGKPKNGDLIPENRTRRATVSGGSPTLKRLSLHVNRKCSLMPNNQALNDAKRSILNRNDKERLKKIYLDTIYGEHSTSSANSGDFLGDHESTESEDDVFEEDNDINSSNIQSSSSSADRRCGDSGKSQKSDNLSERAWSSTFSNKISQKMSIAEENMDFAEVLPLDEIEGQEKINKILGVVKRTEADSEWTTAKHESQETTAPFLSMSDSQDGEDSSFGPVDLSSSFRSGRSGGKENLAPDSIDTSDDLGLRGVVEFEGPVTLPSTLPLTGTPSRQKIESFFGENLSESLTKIYNSDDVSSTSSGSQSRMSTSLPRNSGWSRPLWKKWSNSRLADFLMNRSANSDFALPADEPSASPKLKTHHSFLSPAYPMKSGQSLNSLDTAAEYLANNIELYEICCTPCSNLHKKDEIISNDQNSAPIESFEHQFHESWIHRYRLSCEKRNVKWLKRYAVLCNEIFYIYNNPGDNQAEGVIFLKNCTISPIGSEYKTSKKNVFQIHCCDVNFSFYCTQKKDMVEWLNKLGLAAIGFGNSGNEAEEKSDQKLGYYFPAISIAYRSMSKDKKSSYSNPTLYATSPRAKTSELLVKSLKNRCANFSRPSIPIDMDDGKSGQSKTSRKNSNESQESMSRNENFQK